MRIRVIPVWSELPLDLEGDWQPVVIDVLRATSTIVMALQAGAAEVVPAQTVDEARALQGDGVLLAGERDSLPIAGFDFGNSPLEIQHERVRGRRVVLTTSNGTRALLRARHYGPVACAALVNAAAVARFLTTQPRDALIVCSGSEGRFSADDLSAAGAIVSGLPAATHDHDDLGIVARAWYEANAHDLHAMLSQTRHGRGLISRGTADDVLFCARRDVSALVPIYDRVITA